MGFASDRGSSLPAGFARRSRLCPMLRTMRSGMLAIKRKREFVLAIVSAAAIGWWLFGFSIHREGPFRTTMYRRFGRVVRIDLRRPTVTEPPANDSCTRGKIRTFLATRRGRAGSRRKSGRTGTKTGSGIRGSSGSGLTRKATVPSSTGSTSPMTAAQTGSSSARPVLTRTHAGESSHAEAFRIGEGTRRAAEAIQRHDNAGVRDETTLLFRPVGPAELEPLQGDIPPAPAIAAVTGDLLDQKVDAIVNPWNRNFIPWWLLLPQGVSGAIKRAAGTGPFRELRRHGLLRVGEAVVTTAGRLPFRGIIPTAL